MKQTIVILLFLMPVSVFAQSKVQEKHLDGTWKLYLNLKENAETAGERVVLNAVDGFLAEIDLEFTFASNNELRIDVNAFGSEEIEYSEWMINDRGELVLGDIDQVDLEDTVWLREGERIQAYDIVDKYNLEKKKGVFLERIR